VVGKSRKNKVRARKKNNVIKKSSRKEPIVQETEHGEISYAVFNVGSEKYAINLDSIKEILHDYDIMEVPHLSQTFAGAVKLRGESIPVIDLQVLLQSTRTNISIKPCLIIKIDDSNMGFLVDSDIMIITTEDAKLYPLPDCYTREEIEFIEGILWTKNNFVGVLKPRKMVKILAGWRQENEEI
jgi:purine-binding chemotaxis protein CheW